MPSRAIRFDEVPFRLRADQRTRDGFLPFDGVFTRTGVFRYQNADGSVRRELRLPEQVFSDEHLDTLRVLPVTRGHPDGFVTSENADDLQVGATGDTLQRESHKQFDLLAGSGKVTVEQAIQDALDGVRDELSLGYYVRIEHEGGTHPVFGEYDAVQTRHRGNHLAMVKKARAGAIASMTFDEIEVPGGRFDGDVARQLRHDEAPGIESLQWDGADFEEGEDDESTDDAPDTGIALRRDEAYQLAEVIVHRDGSRLAGLLRDQIEGTIERSSDVSSMADVLSQVANRVARATSTMRDVINARIDCPPIEVLEGFAQVLQVDVSALAREASRDGCQYAINQDGSLDAFLGQEDEMKVTIDGVQYDVPEAVAERFAELNRDARDLETIEVDSDEYDVPAEVADHISGLDGKADGLETKVDELEEEIESLEEVDDESREDVANLWKDRTEALVVAAEMNLDCAEEPLECDLDTDEIKERVVDEKHSDVDVDAKDASYIDAAFDLIKGDILDQIRGDAGKALAALIDDPKDTEDPVEKNDDAGGVTRDDDEEGDRSAAEVHESIHSQYTGAAE